MTRHRPHRWVVAATLDVEPHRAGEAHARERLTLVGKTVVDVLEVYCDHCRRGFDPERIAERCQLGPQHSGGPRRQPDLAENDRDDDDDDVAPGPGQAVLFDALD